MKKILFSIISIAVISAMVISTSCKKEKEIVKEPGDTVKVVEKETEEVPVDNSTTLYVTGGHLTGSTTWTSAKKVLLSGWYYVDSNATLTIQAGTIIQGLVGTKAAIIIKRGGKIYAQGTSTQPIVFTSAAIPGLRKTGDIGGVILCGKANTNVPGDNIQIEGGVDAYYGGSSDDDNSGIIQYLRIEYAGYVFAPNKEINGLTMGAVGSGTTIDHVQVSYGNDDGFEWFGGTVNCKYLISYKSLDDDFDTDYGYTGTVQFGLVIRDKNVADAAGNSNGFESDNDGSGSTNTPITAPLFSNISFFGPKMYDTTTSVSSYYQAGLYLRKNTMLKVYNSLVAGWPYGLHVEGSAAQNNGTNGDLRVRYCVMAGNTTQYYAAYDQTLYTNGVYNNKADSTITSLKTNIDIYTDGGGTTLLPSAGSFLLTGANFGEISGNTFLNQTVTHIGAFGSTDWTSGWANFDPQNKVY